MSRSWVRWLVLAAVAPALFGLVLVLSHTDEPRPGLPVWSGPLKVESGAGGSLLAPVGKSTTGSFGLTVCVDGGGPVTIDEVTPDLVTAGPASQVWFMLRHTTRGKDGLPPPIAMRVGTPGHFRSEPHHEPGNFVFIKGAKVNTPCPSIEADTGSEIVTVMRTRSRHGLVAKGLTIRYHDQSGRAFEASSSWAIGVCGPGVPAEYECTDQD